MVTFTSPGTAGPGGFRTRTFFPGQTLLRARSTAAFFFRRGFISVKALAAAVRCRQSFVLKAIHNSATASEAAGPRAPMAAAAAIRASGSGLLSAAIKSAVFFSLAAAGARSAFASAVLAQPAAASFAAEVFTRAVVKFSGKEAKALAG